MRQSLLLMVSLTACGTGAISSVAAFVPPDAPTLPAGSSSVAPPEPLAIPPEQVASPGPTPEPAAVIPAFPYTLVGRFAFTDPNTVRMALVQSRIGARFVSSSVALRLADAANDVFAVSIDGNAPIVVQTVPGPPRDYPVAHDLPPGPHTLWLTKRTEFLEAFVGVTTFYGLVLDANGTFLMPPPAKSRHIAFVGDSGYTGYGAGQLITGPDDNCSFAPLNEDGTASIPAYTAEFLQAEATNVSSSGQAVFRSVFDANPAHTLPVLYEEILPPAPLPVWDFSKENIDAVVLSAGGNDVDGPNGEAYFLDANGFVSTYVAWLKTLRGHHPKAALVVVLSQSSRLGDAGVLGSTLRHIVDLAREAGDDNVFYYNYFSGDPIYHTYDDVAHGEKFYWGCDYHPSPAGARFLARRLATFVASKKGWDPPP